MAVQIQGCKDTLFIFFPKEAAIDCYMTAGSNLFHTNSVRLKVMTFVLNLD